MAGSLATPTCDALRQNCREVWQRLLDHPFVCELAAGTLPLRKFRFYIEQDILFLDDYARAIGFAIGRAVGDDELRQLTEQLRIVVERELESEHELLRRVEEIVGPRSGPALPAPATSSYSNFLVATAARGDALDVMAALMPCAWSYADIGLAHSAAATEHPIYAEWLRFFGSAEYVGSIDARRVVFDRVAARAASGRHPRLYELFTTAARLERSFWDMAYAEEER